jgi:steroid delta-isomerase-like uncharacterized protein
MAKTVEKAETRSPKSAEDIVRGAFEAIGKHDLDGLRRLYHPDVVDDVVPVRVLRGSSEAVDFFAGLFKAVPDLETSVGRVVTDGGERVAIEWRMSGTFDGGPFEGIDANGKRVDMRGFDLFEVRDGLIVTNTGYYDGAEFMRQIGMAPAQDSGAERAMKSAFNAVTKVRRTIAERTGS